MTTDTYTYKNTHTYTLACTFTHKHTHTHTHTYKNTHAQTHTHTHTHTHTYTHTHARTHARMHACTRTLNTIACINWGVDTFPHSIFPLFRWCILEFAEEALSAHTGPPKSWDQIPGLRGIEKGHKQGELALQGGADNSGDRRGIQPGDFIRLVPVDAPNFMFEAEVKKLSNPMVLKPIDRVDYECVCVALPTLSVYDV